jgi:hypothetical protein
MPWRLPATMLVVCEGFIYVLADVIPDINLSLSKIKGNI